MYLLKYYTHHPTHCLIFTEGTNTSSCSCSNNFLNQFENSYERINKLFPIVFFKIFKTIFVVNHASFTQPSTTYSCPTAVAAPNVILLTVMVPASLVLDFTVAAAVAEWSDAVLNQPTSALLPSLGTLMCNTSVFALQYFSL